MFLPDEMTMCGTSLLCKCHRAIDAEDKPVMRLEEHYEKQRARNITADNDNCMFDLSQGTSMPLKINVHINSG